MTAPGTAALASDGFALHVPKQATLHVQTVDVHLHPGEVRLRQRLEAADEEVKILAGNGGCALLQFQGIALLLEVCDAVTDVVGKLLVDGGFGIAVDLIPAEPLRTQTHRRDAAHDVHRHIVRGTILKGVLCLGGLFQSLDPHGFHLVGHSLVQLLLQLTDLHLHRLKPLG